MRIDPWGTRLRWLLLIGAVVVKSASANLILDGPANGAATALGPSNVVLTIQNLGVEGGCVGFGDVIGSSACPTGLNPPIFAGNELNSPASPTRTETIAATGVSSGENLVVILSPNEVTTTPIFAIQNLSLSIWSPTGTLLFNSGNVSGWPINLNADLAGSLGFAFVLDPLQAAAADPFITGPGAGSNIIGLAALITFSDDGKETFYVVDRSQLATTNIPEPPTVLISAMGVAIGWLIRRRRPFSSSKRAAH